MNRAMSFASVPLVSLRSNGCGCVGRSPWFQDFLINSLATQPKMGIWVTKQCPKCYQHGGANLTNGRLPGTTANGRYRTYEAFSGCDLDPVHVSDYHQIPCESSNRR